MYIDGTSCATPAFGGLVTLINDVRLRNGQPALGFLNPLLYVRCVGNPPLKRMELTHRLAAVSCAGTEHGPMARTASSTSSTATTAVLVETAAVVLALACAALRASQVRCTTYITEGTRITSLACVQLQVVGIQLRAWVRLCLATCQRRCWEQGIRRAHAPSMAVLALKPRLKPRPIWPVRARRRQLLSGLPRHSRRGECSYQSQRRVLLAWFLTMGGSGGTTYCFCLAVLWVLLCASV